MKDQTVFGSEPTQTPVAGVDWAGQTEVGEVTLSDQETLVLARSGRVEAGPASRASANRATRRVTRIWSLARSSLLGAIVCGVLGGLFAALALVFLIRLARGERPGSAPSSDTSALVATIRVEEPSGARVPGATIQIGDRSLQADADGVLVFEERLSKGQGHRFRLDLHCPDGMRAVEGSRELLVSVPAERVPKRIERSLTFLCESTRVEIKFLLRAEGGEARFWLGQEELGSTHEGRLEKTVLLQKRTESVLRVRPIVPDGETRIPRVAPLERTVIVLDASSQVEHTVRIEWPRRKVRSRPRAIPYRL